MARLMACRAGIRVAVRRGATIRTHLWSVATDTGESIQTQHLIAAVGTLLPSGVTPASGGGPSHGLQDLASKITK